MATPARKTRQANHAELTPPDLTIEIRAKEGGFSAVTVTRATSLRKLHGAAEDCQRCPLYLHATHLVFGEGPRDARLMIIGEVPGDREDLSGMPFVGPAGRILDEGLKQAKLERHEVYVTNSVKHCKWEPRGKRRLHKRPSAREITACKPWLEGELRIVRPAVIVCLGAVAAQSLLGRDFRITAHRGEILESPWGRRSSRPGIRQRFSGRPMRSTANE